MKRRQFLCWSAAGACGITLGAAFWRNVFAQPAVPGPSPWYPVPDDFSARLWPIRTYTTGFDGGEGCWYDGGLIYFATKGDDRVWSYNADANRLEVIYDPALHADSPLRGVDNIVVSRSQDIYVAEDGDNMQICLITPEPRVVAPTRAPKPPGRDSFTRSAKPIRSNAPSARPRCA